RGPPEGRLERAGAGGEGQRVGLAGHVNPGAVHGDALAHLDVGGTRTAQVGGEQQGTGRAERGDERVRADLAERAVDRVQRWEIVRSGVACYIRVPGRVLGDGVAAVGPVAAEVRRKDDARVDVQRPRLVVRAGDHEPGPRVADRHVLAGDVLL